MKTTFTYSTILKNKGILGRTNNTIETQTNQPVKIFLNGYTYNKVIIPTKYRKPKPIYKPKPIIKKNIVINPKCISCNEEYYRIKKTSLDICRKCYLDSVGMMICNKCGASKKKNDYLLCFRCFCEVTGKIYDKKHKKY